jgi:SAM-dependent MidA family methyltransferase
LNPGTPEPFEKFMERALHGQANGYYARNIRDLGARGDFTTAPQLSEAPGKAISAWVAEALRETRTRNVIEIGPGLGTLARQVMRNLPLGRRIRTRFHLVESSPTLMARQKSLLGNGIRHHPTIHAALKACSGKAVIFSNELVDAFPVRLFAMKDGVWREIGLDHTGGRATEIFLPPAELPPSSVFQQDFPEGQRVEIHDSYRLWLESWLPAWKRGSMLTIDYGETAEKLYLRRPRGTLRAYLHHQRLEGPAVYANPGLQDITADVNFTDLAVWSRPWLRSEKPIALSDFMRNFTGFPDAGLLRAAEHFTVLCQRTVAEKAITDVAG